METIHEIYDRFMNIQMFPMMGTDLSKRVSFKADYRYVVWNNYVIVHDITRIF